MRVRHKITLGDSGDEGLFRTIRTQGNSAENAPLALAGLLALAAQEQEAAAIQALGAVFPAARVSRLPGPGLGVWPASRLIGALGALISLVATGGLLVWSAFA